LRYLKGTAIVILLLLLTGCVTIAKSRKRPSLPRTLRLSETIKISAVGAIVVNVPFIVNNVDFFPSGFKIVTHNRTIFIDPVLVNDRGSADFILITHSHDDHYSIPDIKSLSKKETVVLCPKNVFKNIRKKLPDLLTKEIRPGEMLGFGDIDIQAVPAYNMKSGLFTPHPKSSLNVGYVIIIDGMRIYHAGDTDYVPEMNSLGRITAAMVPIAGNDLTMSTEKAAELINRLSPRNAIPMHYEIGTGDLRRFKKLAGKEAGVAVLDGQ